MDRTLADKNEPTPSDRLFDLVTANLRCRTAMMWNSDKHIVSFRNEKAGASTICRRNFCGRLVRVRICLLNDLDIARSADRVKAAAFCVVENIVRIARAVDVRD